MTNGSAEVKPRLLTLQQAADALGMTKRGLYERLVTGTAPELRAFKRLGTRWVLPEDAVNAVLKGGN